MSSHNWCKPCRHSLLFTLENLSIYKGEKLIFTSPAEQKLNKMNRDKIRHYDMSEIQPYVKQFRLYDMSEIQLYVKKFNEITTQNCNVI